MKQKEDIIKKYNETYMSVSNHDNKYVIYKK
jgi:hypothetical protein